MRHLICLLEISPQNYVALELREYALWSYVLCLLVYLVVWIDL